MLIRDSTFPANKCDVSDECKLDISLRFLVYIVAYGSTLSCRTDLMVKFPGE